MTLRVPVPTGYLQEKAGQLSRLVDRAARNHGHITREDLDSIRFYAEAIAAEAGRWLEEEGEE